MKSFQSLKSFSRVSAYAVITLSLSVTARAWTVGVATGDVKIESHAADASAPVIHAANVGDQIAEGDSIVTGTGAIALLTEGKSEVRMAANSRLRVEQIYEAQEKKPGIVNLQRGTLRANLKKSAIEFLAPYEIKAKDFIASAKDSDFFVEIAGGSAKVFTLSGAVTVHSKSGIVEVPAGKTVTNNGGASGAIRPVAPELLSALMAETKIEGRDAVAPAGKPHKRKSKQK